MQDGTDYLSDIDSRILFDYYIVDGGKAKYYNGSIAVPA